MTRAAGALRSASSTAGKLAVLLMVACAGAQPAAGSLLASALALHAPHGHHSASVVSAGGHLDLVLAHVERDPPTGDRVPRHDPVGSFSGSDHVVHLTSDDAPPSASRRPGPGPASAPAIRVELRLASARSPLRPAPAPGAHGTDVLRLVVLRL